MLGRERSLRSTGQSLSRVVSVKGQMGRKRFAVSRGLVVFISIIAEAAGRNVTQSTALIYNCPVVNLVILIQD